LPKTRDVIIIAFLITLILAVALVEISSQNIILQQRNDDLSKKLQNATKELEVLKRNYTDLMDIFEANSKGEISPPIETRLGIKLMQGVKLLQSEQRNYLWVTGEVQNTGNLTLYNVRLRYTLYTNNGTDVKEDIIGTMKAQQVVTRRFSAFSSLGAIMNWKLEPVATYEP
jgi:hypothetical protein